MKTVFQNLKKTDWLLAAVCLAFIALQVWHGTYTSNTS